MTKGKSNYPQIPRNHLLDGLRGVAAMGVLVYHAGQTISRDWVSSGFLAVDFFFVLSGFVIASVYEKRLFAGLEFRAFLWQRIARLYPAFAVVLPLGIALTLIKWAAGMLPAPLVAVVTTIILNSLMLPSIQFGGELFVVNAPTWSLFLEMLINSGYARAGFRLQQRSIVAGMMLLAVVLVVVVLRTGTINRGFDWAGAAIGLIRGTLAFGFGTLIARWRTGRKPMSTPWAIIPPVALALLLFVPNGSARWLVDLTFALFIAPLGVLICSGIELPTVLRQPFDRLGAISYPLYILHYPVLRAANQVGKVLHLSQVPVVVAAMAVVVGAAWASERWVEPAGKGWIIALGSRLRWLNARSSAAAIETLSPYPHPPRSLYSRISGRGRGPEHKGHE